MAKSGRYKPYSEWGGWYNIPPLTVDDDVTAEDIESFGPIFRSVPNPPEFTCAEWKAVGDDLLKVIGRAEQFAPWKDSFSIHDQWDDRTLVVCCHEFCALSSVFITFLQQFLRKRHRLWRILIWGEDNRRPLLVYPGQSFIGDVPFDPANTDLIRDFAQRAGRSQDRSGKRERRQLASVLEAAMTLDSEKLVHPACALLRCFRGPERNVDTYWMLEVGRFGYGFDVEVDAGNWGAWRFLQGQLTRNWGDEKDGVYITQWRIPRQSDVAARFMRHGRIRNRWNFGPAIEVSERLKSAVLYSADLEDRV